MSKWTYVVGGVALLACAAAAIGLMRARAARQGDGAPAVRKARAAAGGTASSAGAAEEGWFDPEAGQGNSGSNPGSDSDSDSDGDVSQRGDGAAYSAHDANPQPSSHIHHDGARMDGNSAGAAGVGAATGRGNSVPEPVALTLPRAVSRTPSNSSRSPSPPHGGQYGVHQPLVPQAVRLPGVSCPLALGPAVSTAPAPATARTRTRTRTGLHCSRPAPPPVAIHVVLLLLVVVVVVVVVVAVTVMAGLQRTTTWMLPLGFCYEEALLGGWSYPPAHRPQTDPSHERVHAPLWRTTLCYTRMCCDAQVLIITIIRETAALLLGSNCWVVHFQHTAVSWAQPFHSPP
jgi:hypothetical protein